MDEKTIIKNKTDWLFDQQNAGEYWRRLPQTVFQHPIGQDPWALALLFYCLTKAYTKPLIRRFGGEEKTIPAGSFITSRFTIAEETGINPNTVKHALNRLIKYGFVTKETDRQSTIITVRNWDYQKVGDQGVTNERPTKGTTKRDIERLENKEESKDSSSKTDEEPPKRKRENRALVDFVLREFERIYGYAPVDSQQTARRAAWNIVRRTKRDHALISEFLKWGSEQSYPKLDQLAQLYRHYSKFESERGGDQRGEYESDNQPRKGKYEEFD